MPMMSSTDNKIAGMASQVVFKISGQGGKARSPRWSRCCEMCLGLGPLGFDFANLQQ